MELPKEPTKPKTELEILAENPLATHETFLKKEQIEGFEKLLERNAGEKALDEFLTKNPAIFCAALNNFRTGHHGAIVIPKENIRASIKATPEKGLIPDFLIGGDSSNGWEWWVVELKGSDQSIFVQNTSETYFSTETNRGICQLLEYIDFCAEYQGILRDLYKLENFREPNGLLIVGREAEIKADPTKQRLKAAWNRLHREKLEIRTFDFIGRVLRPMYEIQSK